MSQVNRFIALDTETTGFSHKNGDRILEIGAVEFDPDTGELGEQFHEYVNPGIAVPAAVTEIHGITAETLADKPPFPEVVDALEGFVSGAHVVIHNSQFDVGFLNAEMKRAKRGKFDELPRLITCSRRLARRVLPPSKPARLDDLCDLFGVDRTTRELHGALIDVALLAQVFPHLAKRKAAQDAVLNQLFPFALGAELPGDKDELGRGYTMLSQLKNLIDAEQERIRKTLEPMLGGADYEHRDFTVIFGESVRTNWDKVKKDHLQGVDLEPYQKKSPSMTIKATS